jgi:beta-glucosidase
LQWNALIEAQESGALSEEAINTSVRRLLKLILGSRKMQGGTYGNNPDLEAHAKITRQSAAEGMVLLKNNEVLPLKPAQRIALLGVTSFDFIAGGTGSGDVNESYTVSLETGLLNTGLEQEDGLGGISFTINPAAKNAFQKHKDAQPEAFEKPEGFNAMFVPYNPPQLSYSRAKMEEIADGSDVAVITIGRNSGEGGDRREQDDFLLTAAELEIIALASDVFHKAGKSVVVVLNIGGVIETASWKDQPDAILLAWQGGQEGGNSVADILSGKVNPSGKLPMTFPIKLSDHASDANFPHEGKPMSLSDMLSAGKAKDVSELIPNEDYTRYEEGIYVGYRHFDKENLSVSYPFGYGLSYSSFELDSLQTKIGDNQLEISVRVMNKGSVPGKEVVQIYLSKESSKIDRPVQELKAFAKTTNLEPASYQTLYLSIPLSDLRYWDESTSQWILEPGPYVISAGVSSRDLRQTVNVQL